MNDQLNQPDAETAQPVETATETEVETFGLDDIERRYFSPDQLDGDAQDYINLVTSIPNVAIKSNFDDEVPTGFGLCVMPISKRGEEGTEVIGVVIAAIPDPETIAQHEKGADFIKDVILSTTMAKVANAVRPRANGTTAGSIPFSIESFIEGGRRSGSLKTYTAIASKFVKALKAMGLKFITSGILKQTLSSASFAESQFANIDQENWEKVLANMVAFAKSEGLDPAILDHWTATRNEAEAEVDNELDFSAFDEMV